MSSADSQSRLAQLVEYQKTEMMRQQIMYMQQIKMGVPGGLLGASMPFGESDGQSYSASLAAAAAAVASATGGYNAAFGAGLSGLGIQNEIGQAAAGGAAAAAVGMPVGTASPAVPLTLHPPGSGQSQVCCT